MKGPMGRRKYRVLRTWQCPVCNKRLLTPGSIVTQICACQANVESPRMMRLIEEPRPSARYAPPNLPAPPVPDANTAPGT